MTKKHVCPNGCGNRFHASAHVTQEWCVDGEGNFIEVVNNCLEVTHKPDNDNIWTCVKCGAEAVIKVEIPEGAFEYGDYHFMPYRKFYDGEIDKQLEGDSRP